MSALSDRTIPATPRRRRLAEREGMIPGAAQPAWGATVIVTMLLLPAWWTATVAAATDSMRAALGAEVPPSLHGAVAPAIPTVILVVVSASVGLAVRILLDGLRFHAERALPAAGRVSVLAGVRRMFSADAVRSAIGGAVGMALAALVASRVLPGGFGAVLAIAPPADTAPEALVRLLADAPPAAFRAALPVALAAAVVVVAQWALRRHGAERRLRMTPEELRDELRDVSGSAAVRWSRPWAARPAAAPVAGHSAPGAV